MDLHGKRVGVLTHDGAVDAFHAPGILAYHDRGLNVAAWFGPEHGISGHAQDLIAVEIETDARETAKWYSLYGSSFASLKPSAAMLDGLDCFIIDLQDVGSRYYTFQATMLYCMEACAELGLPVMVFDRPNPIGRCVEGPGLEAGFESFVSVHPIASRHGMTIGELAKLYQVERVPKVDLTVVPCEGWTGNHAPEFVLPPSPNMPTVRTAWVYPGMCFIEGTNLSEGRGTTRPFEYVGFPDCDHYELLNRLNRMELPGVTFLPVDFLPTFQKHANQNCRGVFVYPTTDAFRPVRTGLAILIAFRDLLGDLFQWRTETYEFVSHIPAIDLLFGSDRERTMIETGARWQEIAKLWEPEEAAFRERRKPYLLY